MNNKKLTIDKLIFLSFGTKIIERERGINSCHKNYQFFVFLNITLSFLQTFFLFFSSQLAHLLRELKNKMKYSYAYLMCYALMASNEMFKRNECISRVEEGMVQLVRLSKMT